MLWLIAAVALQAPDTQTFLDPAARSLLERGRAGRAAAFANVAGYDAAFTERIYLGVRALSRDRVFYHRELALRLHWHADAPDTVQVIGAREGVPLFLSAPQVPTDLRGDVDDYVFDPRTDRLRFGLGDSSWIRSPLADGSESDYRFASGDTTTITLPDGATVRIYELRVVPRRSDPHLMAGTLWFEGETWGLVRATFRPARPLDLLRDLDPADSADAKDVPGFLQPITVDARYVTFESGLWEERWWLPRLMAIDAVARVGKFATFPFRYELHYDDFHVQTVPPGAPPPPPPAPPSDTAHDSVAVLYPADTAALLTSAALPPSLAEPGQAPLTRAEVAELVHRLELIPGLPVPSEPVTFSLPWQSPGLLRYNRVEGLSVGVRAAAGVRGTSFDLTARMGTADREPEAEFGVARTGLDTRWRATAYRRLAPVDPTLQPLSTGSSLGALVIGRDDGDYFRAAGAEIEITPAPTLAPAYRLRLFAEHQWSASRRTDWSLAHLLNSSHVFRPNPAADVVDEVGTSLTVRGSQILADGLGGLSGDLLMETATGTRTYGRLALTGLVSVPVGFGLAAAIGGSAGTSAGPLPTQARWLMGGPLTVRGYDPYTMAGDAYWRGRAELGAGIPAARLALFSDVGWAGARADAFRARPLLSVGVGASFLDGLFRVDLARALHAPKGWRLELYSDAVL